MGLAVTVHGATEWDPEKVLAACSFAAAVVVAGFQLIVALGGPVPSVGPDVDHPCSVGDCLSQTWTLNLSSVVDLERYPEINRLNWNVFDEGGNNRFDDS